MVGLNCFRHEDPSSAPEEVFRVDPQASRRVLEKFEAVRERRSQAEVERTLDRLEQAAAADDENLMPHLIECCHAYATGHGLNYPRCSTDPATACSHDMNKH